MKVVIILLNITILNHIVLFVRMWFVLMNVSKSNLFIDKFDIHAFNNTLLVHDKITIKSMMLLYIFINSIEFIKIYNNSRDTIVNIQYYNYYDRIMS